MLEVGETFCLLFYSEIPVSVPLFVRPVEVGRGANLIKCGRK